MVKAFYYHVYFRLTTSIFASIFWNLSSISFRIAFISCSCFSCNDRIFVSSAALISSNADGTNG